MILTALISVPGCGGTIEPRADDIEEAYAVHEGARTSEAPSAQGIAAERVETRPADIAAPDNAAETSESLALSSAAGRCCAQRVISGIYQRPVACDDTSLPSPLAEAFCATATFFHGADYGTLLDGSCAEQPPQVQCPRVPPPTTSPPCANCPPPPPPPPPPPTACAGKCCDYDEEGNCSECIPKGGSCR
jgi:hypothetical protein